MAGHKGALKGDLWSSLFFLFSRYVISVLLRRDSAFGPRGPGVGKSLHVTRGVKSSCVCVCVCFRTHNSSFLRLVFMVEDWERLISKGAETKEAPVLALAAALNTSTPARLRSIIR